MASSPVKGRHNSKRTQRATLCMEEGGPLEDIGISPDPPPHASSSTRVGSGDMPQSTKYDTNPTFSSPSTVPNVTLPSSQPDHIIQCTADDTLAGGGTRSVSESLALLIRMLGRTRWRFLNSLFLLSVGTAKAVSAYQNASTAANTLDLVIGIFWALISYWFSILEVECPNIIPWLFQKPSQQELTVVYMLFLLSSGLLAALTFLYLVLIPALFAVRFVEPLLEDLALGLRVLIFFGLSAIVSFLCWGITTIGIVSVFQVIQFFPLPSINISRLWPPLRLIFQRNDWHLQSKAGRLLICIFLLISVLCFSALVWLFNSESVDDPIPLVALKLSILLIVGLFLGYLILGLVRMTIRLLKEIFTYIHTCGSLTSILQLFG